MTNGERVRCGMSSEPLCQFFKAGEESIQHVLWDCPSVQNFWSITFPTAVSADFLMLTSTIGSSKILPACDHHKDFKFLGLLFSLQSPGSFGSVETMRFSLKIASLSKAPDDWFCLNCDGSVNLVSNLGSAEGVIRDSSGRWIDGFSKNIGYSTNLQAELWGLYEGLRLAWSHDIDRLEIQTDNAKAAKIIDMVDAANSPFPMVRAVASFRARPW
ncbi:hypothetical protein F3Y22_tig00111708pilonHSYRG00019 [Hibiscus syriacus]|uniref:RNase H type-1 domain-containing protein n=1 Tax=Hibiscus syriacus TaxID=106335 RepID=A0A6A2XXH4_HIBSY|nr:uncharacterized protein LOC120168021 [Hibiscus syriacus]KAE8674840.1 hypothetical protein F3Y22_tig00111708pilonHSYRG00019 [Hibiscus syriacus]